MIVASNANLSEVFPVDVFPIRGASNQELIAVGSGPAGGPYITHVDFFDGSTKADTKSYSTLTLSTVYGMFILSRIPKITASPRLSSA